MKPVNKPFSMRLPDGIRAELQTLAQSKGLTESDLGRMLLIEKLAETKSAGKSAEGRTLAALIIAALSETIDFDQARELVAQHVAPETAVPQ